MEKIVNVIKKYDILFLITLFVFIFSVAVLNNTIDMDFWARLLQGNYFFAFGNIMKTDPFSYTPTHIWLDHEWGSSVIFSFFLNNFGFKGIFFLRIFIIFLIFFISYKTIKNADNKLLNILYFPLILLFGLPTLVQSCLRCHFFTFLFFTVFLYILEKSRMSNDYKILYLLPVIMLLWCNIHGGCVAGLGLLFIYTIGEFLNKKSFKHYIFVLVLSLSVLFINPYGTDYVKFLLMASTMPRPFVTEWISPFAHPSLTFLLGFKIIFFINIVFLLFNIKGFKNDYTKHILLFVCAYLSAKYVKNTPFFIITSMIYLYPEISSFFRKLQSKKAEYIIYLVLILLSTVIIVKNPIKPDLSQQPVKVTEFLKINNLGGNIFAPFDIGSYLIYKLYPNNLVYMDGRYEEVYFIESKTESDNFFSVKNNWDSVLYKPIPPDYIIIPADAAVNDNLLSLKTYNVIYSDGYYNLYAKIDTNKTMFYLPSNSLEYYTNNAFVTNFSTENLKKLVLQK